MFDESRLSIKLAPYTFPFLIEYTLLTAAILYKSTLQVGMPVTKELTEVKFIPVFEKMKLMVGRVFVASVCGWIIIAASLAGTIYFIYINENLQSTEDDKEFAVYLFYAMDIALLVIGIVVLVLIGFFMSDVPFKGHSHSFIDQLILIVTIFGFYLMLGFETMPEINNFGLTSFLGDTAKLGTIESVLSYVQASMQLIFIMDAFRRGTQPIWEKATYAPSLAIILLNVNIGLWIISSFVVKETSQNVLMIEYYGSLTWNIILYVTLPLAIFFRFHSTVCIVDIMVEVWMPDAISK